MRIIIACKLKVEGEWVRLYVAMWAMVDLEPGLFIYHDD